MLGLGCMRLSTAADRDDARGIEVVLAALAAGVGVVDTADAYALNDEDMGHNERLVARALEGWGGPRPIVATKGGMTRPGGRWVPNGGASHLHRACEASLRALGVDRIDVYQLHTPDPRTALATSVRALRRLHDAGMIAEIGLCNITLAQLEAALDLAPITWVQVAVSPIEVAAIRGGVVQACRDRGIRVIAHSPLGGPRGVRKIRNNRLLAGIAPPERAALAWSIDLGLIPIPGPRTVAAAHALADLPSLDDGQRAVLDTAFPAGRLLRVPRSERQPPEDADGEVVLVVGMPGAGKSTAAREWVDQGYVRLNRDDRGGGLRDLLAPLEAGLARGERRFVLDNTYATRATRSEVIEVAWRHGVPVRCVVIQTDLAHAQVNAIRRILGRLGRLPRPEELKRSKEPWMFGPDAQFRYLRAAEEARLDEGFVAVDVRGFERPGGVHRALVVEVDDVLISSGAVRRDRVAVLEQRRAEGWIVIGLAWRPQGGNVDVPGLDVRVCPHPPGPPVCWCRKPLPGSVLEALGDREVDPGASLVVGRSTADRTLADKLGFRFVDHEGFFSVTPP